MTQSDSKEPDGKISVAFVCLGNICRSPMAEAVFTSIVKDLGKSHYFKRIDSFGTGAYHTGEDPDHRSVATCKRHGVPVCHKAQQIKPKHFHEFEYIIAMDSSNKANLLRIKPQGSKAIVKMFGEWRTDSSYGEIVEDPYYGGSSGFERNYNQICHFSNEFLKQELS
ncbi:hypothetical protein PACTADRAFT_49720 [Pachysolen tannophilus NRRL Y-2460]|uniref:Phosphotyrosine protein phosphatase I domain-containing protein n=1 Tax=Pachysolen tannophilus NRRL Y-2460 TaxID=669874 RepID=A0A1E4TX77_PACTA|nr:hypothetical protein PACTADRAFT_49720 [Pachysolen tannophilus NRRL Y-2460]